MVTNAVPIVAGFALFGDVLPKGTRAGVQIAAFAGMVLSVVALGHQTVRRASQPAPRDR
jgi:hypothetical protein